jgi:hypothetical protein
MIKIADADALGNTNRAMQIMRYTNAERIVHLRGAS